MKTFIRNNSDYLLAIVIALALFNLIPVVIGWIAFILLFIANDNNEEVLITKDDSTNRK
ncbi:hypothetical protein [Pedobacter sp. MR2016-24]|uniref:hypothetical protein n=1 Tax=Pedobacter sp. MR2016-24 TaxID=2994466 RepID=UPI00224755AA|nr:hypothetical protein [Pedobacter sp. MR2016-24]MCX2486589.1 hypothetical protein [Pedobacter sp. MR2016-24]